MKTRPKEAFYQSFIARSLIHVPLFHLKLSQALKGRDFLAYQYVLAPVGVPWSQGCSSGVHVGRVAVAPRGGRAAPWAPWTWVQGRVRSCPPYVPSDKGSTQPPTTLVKWGPHPSLKRPLCMSRCGLDKCELKTKKQNKKSGQVILILGRSAVKQGGLVILVTVAYLDLPLQCYAWCGVGMTLLWRGNQCYETNKDGLQIGDEIPGLITNLNQDCKGTHALKTVYIFIFQ